MGSKGGKALVEKYGRAHMSDIGKVGFQATTDRYFGGDRRAHLDWLVRTGRFVCDRDLSYHKPELYGTPGPHPAWFQGWSEWLIDAERNITGFEGPLEE